MMARRTRGTVSTHKRLEIHTVFEILITDEILKVLKPDLVVAQNTAQSTTFCQYFALRAALRQHGPCRCVARIVQRWPRGESSFDVHVVFIIGIDIDLQNLHNLHIISYVHLCRKVVLLFLKYVTADNISNKM